MRSEFHDLSINLSVDDLQTLRDMARELNARDPDAPSWNWVSVAEIKAQQAIQEACRAFREKQRTPHAATPQE